jgi:hypothetical protein
LQKKYANPKEDSIPLARRFVCCVNLTIKNSEPKIYIFPADVVAKGLNYYLNGKFPDSDSYHLSLNFKPQSQTKLPNIPTVREHINAACFLENYESLGVDPVPD